MIVTNMTNMFNGCYALQTVPLFNTALVTAMNGMFLNCYALQTVPAFQAHVSLTTVDYTSWVLNCSNLSEVGIIGVRNNISFINCKLDKANLVIIFNNLETVSGKTITITGNVGASLLTPTDRLIATSKGWTIIG